MISTDTQVVVIIVVGGAVMAAITGTVLTLAFQLPQTSRPRWRRLAFAYSTFAYLTILAFLISVALDLFLVASRFDPVATATVMALPVALLLAHLTSPFVKRHAARELRARTRTPPWVRHVGSPESAVSRAFVSRCSSHRMNQPWLLAAGTPLVAAAVVSLVLGFPRTGSSEEDGRQVAATVFAMAFIVLLLAAQRLLYRVHPHVHLAELASSPLDDRDPVVPWRRPGQLSSESRRANRLALSVETFARRRSRTLPRSTRNAYLALQLRLAECLRLVSASPATCPLTPAQVEEVRYCVVRLVLTDDDLAESNGVRAVLDGLTVLPTSDPPVTPRVLPKVLARVAEYREAGAALLSAAVVTVFTASTLHSGEASLSEVLDTLLGHVQG